jgi:hypothetical protein
MNKIISLFALAALLSSCVITRPVTREDLRDTTDPGVSFASSLVPGLTQFMNGEELKGALFILSTIGAVVAADAIPSIEGKQALAFLFLGAYAYQYGDGVYTSYLFNSQRDSIMMKIGAESHDERIQSLTRYGLDQSELDRVRKRDVWIGMPVEALYVSRGYPDQENKTITLGNIRIQHVYQEERVYIYSENGYVTAWQK